MQSQKNNCSPKILSLTVVIIALFCESSGKNEYIVYYIISIVGIVSIVNRVGTLPTETKEAITITITFKDEDEREKKAVQGITVVTAINGKRAAGLSPVSVQAAAKLRLSCH